MTKVVTLSMRAVKLILARAQDLAIPRATEVQTSRESPISAPGGPVLDQRAVTALEKAARGPLIDGYGYQVALQPDEAAALIAWCGTVAKSVSEADASVFRATADTIAAA
jgi:hypothetical protein